jgi:RNA polymerase sigma-70 factor (sigma-E family)
MRAEHEREYIEYVRSQVRTLRRTAYRLCGDWHRADDLVQGALVLLYRHWRHATAAASLDAYVRRIVVNVFLEDQRRGWFRRVVPGAEARPDGTWPGGTWPDGVRSARDAEGDAATRLDLRAALSRLSPGQRAVLVLRYWEGLDVAATAEALGCAVGTVKSQTSHAIAALRRLLPDYTSNDLSTKGGDAP